ncbi:FxLD family lanthipeptide [Streptomyces sp. NPDC002795]|uniref:FxLD family lanthipeptide n=1 Tax=Streptomyces sp. NPDC002795 TaxID=3364665 RepID=UPI0036A0B5DF
MPAQTSTAPQAAPAQPPAAKDLAELADEWQLSVTITGAPRIVISDCDTSDGCKSTCASSCAS